MLHLKVLFEYFVERIVGPNTWSVFRQRCVGDVVRHATFVELVVSYTAEFVIIFRCVLIVMKLRGLPGG